MTLTQQQLEHYHRDGYVVVKNLLTVEEVDILRERADLIATGKADAVPEESVQVEPGIRHGDLSEPEEPVLAVRKIRNLTQYDDVMRAHAMNGKILDIVQDILGTEDIMNFGDQLFMKPPRHGSRKSYHQDSRPWRYIKPYDLVSCWAAMDDATTENGCLWVLPGSHKWGLVGTERVEEVERLTLEGRLNDEGLEEIPVELSAGDCSFHHSLLLHSSTANKSDRRRRGYATHYMRSTSQFIAELAGGRPKPDYLLVRGRAYQGCV
jgi:phytanoyl-CoA hydroxylase